MAVANALFTADELAGWLHQPAGSIDDSTAGMVELVVWGWMKPALGMEARPAVLTDAQKAWAVQLAGIAFSNPEGLARYVLESEESFYDQGLRKSILDDVAAGEGKPSGAPATPKGRFPQRTPADCFPDPARPNGRGWPWSWRS